MLIRPRLTDFHNVHIPQSELDFAIPFLNEDIPLYVDRFLMWKSPSLQDKGLHHSLLSAFNNLGRLAKEGNRDPEISQLLAASECNEVGFGSSSTRAGKPMGLKLAGAIIDPFESIEFYRRHGFRHMEEIQLLVPGINKDRISDIACSLLKGFLIDYTHQECLELRTPMQEVSVSNVFDPGICAFERVKTTLPVHPEQAFPILSTPKRWLHHVPWISHKAYFRHHCPQADIAHEGEEFTRVKVLTYNRGNYGVIDGFIN